MQSCTVPNALSTIRLALRDDNAPAPGLREHACTAQQHLSSMVHGAHEQHADLMAPPHPLRDELLRPSHGVLFGGAAIDEAEHVYHKLRFDAQVIEVVGAAVMRTRCCTFGVAVCMQYDDAPAEEGERRSPGALVLVAPSAPLALLEQEMLCRSGELTQFEESWAGAEAPTLRASHEAIADFTRGVGAARFPAELFCAAHGLVVEGPVAALSLGTPASTKEMRMAAAAARAVVAAGWATAAKAAEPLVRLVQHMTDSASVESRAVPMRTVLHQHGHEACHSDEQLQQASTDAISGEDLEDLLYRPVVAYVAAVLALRVDADATLSRGNFEVRVDAIVRALPQLTAEQRRALASKLSALQASELRERQAYASGATRTVLALYPPTQPTLLFQTPQLSYAQILVDGATHDQLPGALTGCFERGFHAAELLRVKYRPNVRTYLTLLSGLLSARHAIALLDCTCPAGAARWLYYYTADRSEVVLRARDLPRLAFSPWCLVLVLQQDDTVALLKTAGVQTEPLCFSSKARGELASVAPDMAPLAEQLLLELRNTQAWLARLAQEDDSAPAQERPRLEPPEAKRLRTTLAFFREAMAR